MQGGTRTERNGITFFWTTITEISHKTTFMLMIMWKICLLFPRLNGVLPTSRSSVAPSSSLMIYDCHIFISYFIAWRVPYHFKIIGENYYILRYLLQGIENLSSVMPFTFQGQGAQFISFHSLNLIVEVFLSRIKMNTLWIILRNI